MSTCPKKFRLLAFDTETTGLLLHPDTKDSLQPRIIEFACIVVDGDCAEVESFVSMINPRMRLEPIITKITGITQDMLTGMPHFAEVMPEITRLIASADVVVAHNMPFDSGMLDVEFARCLKKVPWPERMVCTVQEHAEEWGFRPKLTQLYEHYTGKKMEQTHRALDDVRHLLTVVRLSGLVGGGGQ